MLTQSTTADHSSVATGDDPLAALADRSLLIVEDNKPFSTRLARAMESRGYDVSRREHCGGDRYH